MEVDASEGPPWTHLLARGFLGGWEPSATFSVQHHTLLMQQLVMRLDPKPTSTPATRERRAVPKPQRAVWLRHLAQARQPHPWLLSNPLMRVVILARA